MKLFSLISKDTVQIKPGQKRIPASEFSELKNAAEILEKIQLDGEEYKKEIASEAEKIKEAASKEGFQQGLANWNEKLLELEKELKKLRDDVSEKILPLALSAAKKILGEELKIHPERIVSIILAAVKPVTQHKKIHIYVNKVDLPIVEEKKAELKQAFEHLESLVIQERPDVEPGGCMIETEAGIINAQLENQWRALESAFQAFKKGAP